MNIIKKLIKYIILLLVIFSSIIFITKSKINTSDSLLISLIGTTTFAVIDQYAPSYIIKQNKLK
jgi:hypothetical protein